MQPQFNTQTELMSFIRSLTPDTDYAALLKEQFGLEVPTYAMKYQQEYLYKYMVQEQYRGTPANEMLDRSREQVEKLVNIFPHILSKYEDGVKTESTVSGGITQTSRKVNKVGVKEFLRGMFPKVGVSLTMNEMPGAENYNKYTFRDAISALKNPKYAGGELVVIEKVGDKYTRVA